MSEHRPHRPSPWLLWPSVAGATFLLARASTTLAGGASFAAPGDGWRSVWQLLLAGILVAGIVDGRLTRAAIGTVGAVYVAATALELLHDGTQLLMVVPVDMRDRVVHPLIAALALVVLVIDLRRRDAAAAR